MLNMQRVKPLLKLSRCCPTSMVCTPITFSYTTDLGGGAGTGGGAGGSIREAGGSMGKMAAANEEKYFYDLQRQQIEKLKDDIPEETNIKENAKEVKKVADDMYVTRMKKE